MKRLIITADDFGLSLPVNEAIERAHREGVLTSASLMVGAPAAADAVARARRLPGLNVGLHVVVARGRPVLGKDVVPDLIGPDGYLPNGLAGAGVRFFFIPWVRRQLEAEIRAQFEAFKATGFALDHVNAHNHMHLHPTVLGLILRIGADYGLRAVRVPYEPLLPSWRGGGDGLARRAATALFLAPWVKLVAYRLRRAGVAGNDYVFGLHDTGRMTRERTVNFVARLPEGVSELFFHPATAGGTGERPLSDPAACAAELDALLSVDVRNALAAHGVRTLSFSELAS